MAGWLNPRYSVPGTPPIAPDRRSEPFLWGPGGGRTSMDEIALKRRLAAQQLATGSDFSPVGHWAQGLARVASGLAGGLNMREADAMAEESRSAQQQIIEGLFSNYDPASGGPDPVAAALADPELREVGMAVLKSREPKAEDVPDVVALARIANDPGRPDWERQAAKDRITAMNDPMTTATVGDVFFSGRASQLPRLLGEAGYSAVGGQQVIGSELPEGWTIEERGPASAPGGFPGR